MTLLKNIQKLLAELANEHDSAEALDAWAQLTDVIDKLEQHAKDYPNATPVSDISEGNLRDEWAAKAAAKDKKLFGQA